jgi:hypothetical protein
MTPKEKKEEKSSTIEDIKDFPFNSPYDDLIAGQTLSKRGAWWTAVLLVKSKEKKSDNSIETAKSDKKQNQKQKIIIQRWQKIKRKPTDDSEEGTEFWMRKKDFALSKKAHWNDLKKIIDSWIKTDQWLED